MVAIAARNRRGRWASRGQHMKNRCQLLLLMVAVLVGAAVGIATQALAQTFMEFPIPTVNSGPNDITAGPDGAMWFTEGNGNKIGRMTTADITTEFPIPTVNSGPFGITAGPDGALWFTELGGNKIGRITTAGVITEFAIPNSSPGGITAGPDGALWFA